LSLRALKKGCDMVSLKLARPREEHSTPEVDAPSMAFLNHLRFISMACRVQPRADLFEACALLAASRTASREAHAEALMRCLHEAVGKRITLFSPGTAEISFDEAWLLQLGRALCREDEASVSFLLGRRVAPENRRLIRFLVGRIAECFSLI